MDDFREVFQGFIRDFLDETCEVCRERYGLPEMLERWHKFRYEGYDEGSAGLVFMDGVLHGEDMHEGR